MRNNPEVVITHSKTKQHTVTDTETEKWKIEVKPEQAEKIADTKTSTTMIVVDIVVLPAEAQR